MTQCSAHLQRVQDVPFASGPLAANSGNSAFMNPSRTWEVLVLSRQVPKTVEIDHNSSQLKTIKTIFVVWAKNGKRSHESLIELL